MIFMCVFAYMYVLYIIPQYHVFIVYINPITTFIVYIVTFYSMFYAFDVIMFLLYLNDENADGQVSLRTETEKDTNMADISDNIKSTALCIK